MIPIKKGFKIKVQIFEYTCESLIDFDCMNEQLQILFNKGWNIHKQLNTNVMVSGNPIEHNGYSCTVYSCLLFKYQEANQ